MRGEPDEELLRKRLGELAERSERTGCCFTDFLTPPEADWASAAARKCGVECSLFGGYEDAERRMARFGDDEQPFPIGAVMVTWRHQTAPTHRDLLGSVMALGMTRGQIGDIVLEAERAFVFAHSRMVEQLMDTLATAGRTRLSLERLAELPELAPVEGTEVRGTVSSLRLDAVLSDGFGLSRATAAELIVAGQAKLCHLPTERPDARVREGDAISLRGYGRLVLVAVGQPTKKGRIPITLTRYGERRGR